MLDQTFKIAVDPFLRGKDQAYAQCQEMSTSPINYEMIYSNESKPKERGCKILSKESCSKAEINHHVNMDPDEPNFTSLDDDGLHDHVQRLLMIRNK
jgi:hypothetical protein